MALKKSALIVLTLLSLFALASPAFAAVSVSTNKAIYSPGDAVSVSGTVSPLVSGEAVTVRVSNPAGGLWVLGQASPDAAGAWSVSNINVVSQSDLNGIYIVNAAYAGQTGSTSFSVTGAGGPAAAAAALQLLMSIDASTPLLPGQSGRVYVLLSWANGSLASVSNFPIQHFHPPEGALVNLAAFQTVHPGLYFFDFPAQTAAGSYAVHIQANVSNVKVQDLKVITVSDKLASATELAAVKGDLATAKTDLASLRSELTSTRADLSTLKSDLASVKASADAAKTAAESASSAVGNVSTFVLVVAALAAITLVLQIAILIRRART